jgi:hypothetical protein
MVLMGAGLAGAVASWAGDGTGDGEGGRGGCTAALTHSNAEATFKMPPEMRLMPAESPGAGFTGCARLVDLMQRMTCAAVAVGNALRMSSAAAATCGVACGQGQTRHQVTVKHRLLSHAYHAMMSLQR